MRRVAVVVALVSSTIACGGFLGFGDDDDDDPVRADGGTDAGVVDSADGGSNIEALPPGCTRRAFSVKGTSDLDAAIAAQGWNSNVAGNASMTIDNGQLVLRSSGVGPNTYDEANVSFRHDGKLARITCQTNVQVSSFAGNSRFVWLRVYDTALWDPFYNAYAEWLDGQLGAPVQARYVNDSGTIDVFPRASAPPPGTSLPLLVELVVSPASFRVRLGDVDITHAPTAPGAPDVARVILGTHTSVGSDAGAYEIRYDDIDCVVCDVPP